MKMIVASSCSSLQLRQNVVKPCRASLRPLVVRAAVRKDKPAVEPVTGPNELAKRVIGAALGTTTALSLILSPAIAASELVRLPASTDPAVFAAQRTLVEAWTIVGHSFVDPAFNGHDWEVELREHMMKAYNSGDGSAALGEIAAMLEELGDPYTRRIPPEEYAAFRVSSDGELQGVGMLIANEPVNGHLLVLAPIKGGPADRAGILPGDEVTSINGVSTEGWNGEKAARLLRGKGGTEVHVRLARRSAGIPGVPARPDPPPAEPVEYRDVSLRRERVQLSPLFFTTLPAPQLPPGTGGLMPISTDGRVRSSSGPVGYIRLTSFSSNAAAEMRDAIQELEAAGASAYILDLRNNPGGLVRSSIDIARLWLDGSPVVFNVSGREGDELQQQVVDTPGAALTHRPLAVLVNGGSASASEILSGALHDNARAVVLGDEHTYGKGRIQSVFELQDGSALFVTVARYQTPAGTEIDRIGIKPDRACSMGGAPTNTFVAGLPMVPGSSELLVESLMEDSCVMAARDVLQQQVAVVANAATVASQIPGPARGAAAAALPASTFPSSSQPSSSQPAAALPASTFSSPTFPSPSQPSAPQPPAAVAASAFPSPSQPSSSEPPAAVAAASQPFSSLASASLALASSPVASSSLSTSSPEPARTALTAPGADSSLSSHSSFASALPHPPVAAATFTRASVT